MSHNSFQSGAWDMFQQAWECWVCGRNTADALHHIVGRGSGDSTVESSVYNAAPLCNQSCHLPNHGKLRTDSPSRRLLRKTKEYLNMFGYSPSDLDYQFMEKYAKLYNPGR